MMALLTLVICLLSGATGYLWGRTIERERGMYRTAYEEAHAGWIKCQSEWMRTIQKLEEVSRQLPVKSPIQRV